MIITRGFGLSTSGGGTVVVADLSVLVDTTEYTLSTSETNYSLYTDNITYKIELNTPTYIIEVCNE